MDNRKLAGFALFYFSLALGILSISDLFSLFYNNSYVYYSDVTDPILTFLKAILGLTFAYAVYSFSKDMRLSSGDINASKKTIRTLTLTFIGLAFYWLAQIIIDALKANGVIREQFGNGMSSAYYNSFDVSFAVFNLVMIAISLFIVYKLLPLGKGATIKLSKVQKLNASTKTSKILGGIFALILLLWILVFANLTIYEIFNNYCSSYDYSGVCLDSATAMLQSKIVYSMMWLGATLLGLALMLVSIKFIFSKDLQIPKLSAMVGAFGSLILGISVASKTFIEIIAALFNINAFPGYYYSINFGTAVSLAFAISMILFAVLMWRNKSGYQTQIRVV